MSREQHLQLVEISKTDQTFVRDLMHELTDLGANGNWEEAKKILRDLSRSTTGRRRLGLSDDQDN